jgi:hypothetical protein
MVGCHGLGAAAGGGAGMTPDEHQARHVLLHRMFDELLADWIGHTGLLPSQHSVMEFMDWSYAQTVEPTEPQRHMEE